jgi:hypothetical protein
MERARSATLRWESGVDPPNMLSIIAGCRSSRLFTGIGRSRIARRWASNWDREQASIV